ncbi:MAG TPA: zinc ribbon domain-containing protein [Frankiaceae bacterium]|nr:zinc ribbon domain-containing protein [Frankiaceae bacterium]
MAGSTPRIAALRRTLLHEISTQLAAAARPWRIEDLNAAGMVAERTYSCPACGLELDRDLNAAINTPEQDIKHAPPRPAAA